MRPIAESEESAVVRTLDNGLTVAIEPLPHVRSVTIGVWIKAGSAHETAQHAGISHFLEHLLFKGTARRTARQIVEDIESKGGQLNAFTSREYTCVYAKVLQEHVTNAIDVLADIVKHSQFFDLEKERNVILEEIASAEDVPEEYIHDRFTMRLWPDEAIGRPVAGFSETVSAIGIDDIEGYHRAWYRPDNMIVAAAGAVDGAELYDQLARAFEGLATDPLGRKPLPPKIDAGVESIVRDGTSQSHLCFGFPGVAALDDRRYTYDILSTILGGGATSRLFERVREDEGLAYSIYSFNHAYPLTGMFGVYAAVAPENLEQAADLCFAELRDLRDNPVSEYEISINRELLKGGLLMALESTFNRMARMGKSLLYHDRIVPVDEIIEKLDAVTPDDVQRAAAGLFDRERCALLVLGPRDEDGNRLVQL